MSDDPEHAPLSIGVVASYQGSCPAWKPALQDLMRRVRDECAGVSSPLHLNVVFYVPGDYLQPDFDGVRSGKYSRNKNLLMVQVALPAEPTKNARTDLLGLMSDAIDCAVTWGHRRRLPDIADLEDLRLLVGDL